MSVEAGFSDGNVADAAAGTEDQQTGGNPAWQELYGVLPDSLHTVVAPVLEKWEQGTQSKFNEYAEKSKAYEPYQTFVDNQIAPDQIEQALAVAQLIESDPQGFMQQMQSFFPGEQQQQTQQPQGQQPEGEGNYFEEKPFDLESDPRFQQLAQQQEIIANAMSQQYQAEIAKQEDAALDAELTRLREAHGEFDEEYVFGVALNNGGNLEAAVQKYNQMVEGIRQRPAADAHLPNVITPGGGMPSEAVNPADMTPDQRKAYVMNVLAQANNQGA